MTQKISAEFANETFRIKPGDRFHRLIALLTDNHYDDVTDQRIEDLERHVESWRWMNAAGERVDR